MNMGARQYAVNSYKSGVYSGVEEAGPHRLIQMLYEGSLERIATAKGAILRQDIPLKGKSIGQAISIVGGLRSSLDFNQGEIAANLDSLYDYIERRLVEANVNNDVTVLDEVSALLRDIKSAWDAIGGTQN